MLKMTNRWRKAAIVMAALGFRIDGYHDVDHGHNGTDPTTPDPTHSRHQRRDLVRGRVRDLPRGLRHQEGDRWQPVTATSARSRLQVHGGLAPRVGPDGLAAGRGIAIPGPEPVH
jgi:hypothetical protein